MDIVQNKLIGVWQLVSWVSINNNGEENFPFGDDAQGYLLYSGAGVMSVHLSHKERKLFQSPSIFSVTPEEALQSYHSYASYSGHYEVKDNKVLHHVVMHTSPNWIGTTQERYFKLENNLLHLSHELEGSRQQLTWQKVLKL